MSAELYPNAPSAKTTGTSEDAARSMDGRAETLRAAVLNLVRDHDLLGRLTADEAAEKLGETPLSIRPRFSELKALGKIYDTGIRRKNDSGRNAVVWAASRPGEQIKLL